MRLRARLLRILRVTTIALVLLLILAFAYVRIQQHLLRHRAERLLSDFQSIRLNQTPWADAQSVMDRWGGWGYATGACSEKDCYYTIAISDAPDRLLSNTLETRPRILWSALYRLYWLFGGGDNELLVHFTVQDSIVVQSSIHLLSVLPNSDLSPGGIPLSLDARSRISLSPRAGRLERYEQVALHPDYIAGRPAACTVCESVTVTYTPELAPAELARLTNFDLTCITRYHACAKLADFLHVAEVWHLWDDSPAVSSKPDASAHPCNIPPTILGRDAQIALEVDVLDNSTEEDNPSPDPTNRDEVSTVRLVRVLKNTSQRVLAPSFKVIPFSGYFDDPTEHEPEHLSPSHRYVLLIDSERLDFQGPVDLNWCGVLRETPQTLTALDSGIALDKPIRHPEHDDDLF